MSLQSRFGAALQLARKNKGLTQEDFSIASSRTYISTLERGLKSPTLEKIDEIATVLGIHPLTLIALAYTDESGVSIKDLCKTVESEVRSLQK
jgi:transcriptional regulator with XRE-family HTH domain